MTANQTEPATISHPAYEQGRPKLSYFRPGIYLHYKGKIYQAENLAGDANDQSRLVVHYLILQPDRSHEGPLHQVRSWGDWYAFVHADGKVCNHARLIRLPDSRAHSIPRFRYLGPVFQSWMLEADPWKP